CAKRPDPYHLRVRYRTAIRHCRSKSRPQLQGAGRPLRKNKKETPMRKLLTVFLFGSILLFALPPAFAQAPDGEHCAFTTSSNPDQAIPPYVGSGTSAFSENQNLCLPQLAP